jgi:hypothetical protein
MADRTAIVLYPIVAPASPAGAPGEITCRVGEVIPEDIALQPLATYSVEPPEVIVSLWPMPMANMAAESVCYLYPVIPPTPVVDDQTTIVLSPVAVPAPFSGDPGEITCRSGETPPEDIVLSPLATYSIASPEVVISLVAPRQKTVVAPEVVITLHSLLVPDGAPPAITYFGILKRWAGAWVKARLRTSTGVWSAEPLRRWSGSAWLEVDATGV